MAVYVSNDTIFNHRMNSLDSIINEHLRHIDAITIVSESYGIVLEGEKWDNFKKKVKDAIDKIIQKIKEFLAWIKEKITNLFNKIRGKSKDKKKTAKETKETVQKVESVAKAIENKVEMSKAASDLKEHVKGLINATLDKAEDFWKKELPISAYDIEFFANMTQCLNFKSSPSNGKFFTVDDIFPTFVSKASSRTADGILKAYESTFKSTDQNNLTVEKALDQAFVHFDEAAALLKDVEKLKEKVEKSSDINEHNMKYLNELRSEIDHAESDEVFIVDGRNVITEINLLESTLFRFETKFSSVTAKMDSVEDTFAEYGDMAEKNIGRAIAYIEKNLPDILQTVLSIPGAKELWDKYGSEAMNAIAGIKASRAQS